MEVWIGTITELRFYDPTVLEGGTPLTPMAVFTPEQISPYAYAPDNPVLWYIDEYPLG